MKVLHVISDKNIGGAGILLLNLLSEMRGGEFENVVALPKNGALTERLSEMGVPHVGLLHPCDRISAGAVREICDIIKRENVSLVHANAALSARVAGRRCGIGVVHTRHCCFPPTGIWRASVVRRLGGVWNRMLSDRVIATADAAAENLHALGIPQKKISVIINGSKPIRAVSEEELETVRCSFSIQPNDFCIGICARLESYKGQDVFLHAAKRLTERAPQIPFCFLIVGTGTRRDALEQLANQLAISDVVRFTGFVADMAPIYRLLRINVNCSSGTETSCLAVSEGMSAGVPCAVSDYGGNRAMIGDSEAGCLFPVGDAEALAECMLRIATDHATEERMRIAARERYETHYTAQRMANEVQALYRELLK